MKITIFNVSPLSIRLSAFLNLFALNRRHLTEGQKAVLANDYSAILSEKLSSEAGKEKANARWHPESECNSENVSEQHNQNNKKEKNDALKIAAERWKVSEWNVITDLGDSLQQR